MKRETRSTSSRRGSNAVIFGLTIFTSCGFASLAIDLGFQRASLGQLQASVDSIAESGASRLNGSDDGVAASKALVETLIAAHDVFGYTLDTGNSTIDYGIYTKETGFVSGGDLVAINALDVTIQMPNLPALFAVTMNINSLSVSANALAVAGDGGAPGAASTVDCFIPLAIPGCLSGLSDEAVKDMSFKLSSDKEDTTGWAGVGEHPSANYVKSQIGDCKYSGPVSIDGGITLDNGSKTSGLKALAEAINGSTTEWDESKYGPIPPQLAESDVANFGYVYEGPIMFFEKPGEDFCDGDGGKFTGDAEVMGFAWGVVYDIRANGSLGEEIKMILDTTEDHEVEGSSGGGAPDHGVHAPGNGGTSYTLP